MPQFTVSPAAQDDSGMSLLPGEEASKVFPNVSLLRGSPDAGPKTLALGALCITNFRVYFREVRLSHSAFSEEGAHVRVATLRRMPHRSAATGPSRLPRCPR